jgi:uncharacterized 2Fe-2S/4Fe-4S cluster protein (DUF4445 family)
MAEHVIKFDVAPEAVTVPTGTLLTEAARQAEVDIQQPCGGQGRCGRCAVHVDKGTVRRRSTMRLNSEDVESGYALACQTVIEDDASIIVPPQEKIERRLTTDRTAVEVKPPEGYNPDQMQTIRRVELTLSPPSMDDQIDDWSRLQTAIRQQSGFGSMSISLQQLQQIGGVLRDSDWQVTAIVDAEAWDCPDCPARLIKLIPDHPADNAPVWGIAVDIGTTTVTVCLTDLLTGEVQTRVAEYNGQISRGEDVISRIIYAGKNKGDVELRNLVLGSINNLVETACKRAQIQPDEVVKAVIAGNSTMIHLLLGIPAASIRLAPFVTAINHIPTLLAHEVGVNIHPDAAVDCLPGIASYVGSDISAGVLASGLDNAEAISLFIDVGTNGEIVLGNNEWLATCACSAGPAFEGGGVQDGMRATKGAIEEVWVNNDTHAPTYRVIGGTKPRGICGSGLISLLAELFIAGVIDKGGNIDLTLSTTRTRQGEHGPEYVVTWADDTAHGRDIVITRVDIDNLLRAKAAIYAGYAVLADSVGIPLEMVEQVLVGGSFGKYINVEKAVEIGLLPDVPWDNFHFLGNTSVRGAYLALLDRQVREKIKDIASRMTYIELSADNTFYDAFTSALFLPHTDLSRFPTVQAAMSI